VSIIIPTKDQYTLLKTTVDSILQKTDYPNYEIILINNNSTSPQFFDLVNTYTAQHNNFTCIDAPIPFNFSRLINIGASAAKGEYLLLLNNDMEVRHNNWLTLMVAYAQKEGVGTVGAKLLYPDGTIQHAGISLSAGDDGAHLYAHLPAEAAGTQTINNYSAVTGACLLCDKSNFDMVEGMNEDLPVEYNDLDLCLRIQALGFYTVYLPYVTLIHHESATRGHPLRSKASWQQHRQDQAVFAAAWQPLITNDPYYNPNRKIKFTGTDQ
jgi:GT2 family glycosyltransferase